MIGTVTCVTPDCFMGGMVIEVPESDSYMCGACSADLFPTPFGAEPDPAPEPEPEPVEEPVEEPTPDPIEEPEPDPVEEPSGI